MKRKKTQLKKSTPNPFEGENDTYLTKNKIAVTTTKTTAAKRGYTKTVQTKYYAQNPSNMRKLKAAKGNTVRVGRTGNTYKGL